MRVIGNLKLNSAAGLKTIEELTRQAQLISKLEPERFCVVLSAYGDIDRGGNPGFPICQGRVEKLSALAEIPGVCREYISENNLGAGQWAGGQVFKGGKQIAEASYNGRVRDSDGFEIEISKTLGSPFVAGEDSHYEPAWLEEDDDDPEEGPRP